MPRKGIYNNSVKLLLALSILKSMTGNATISFFLTEGEIFTLWSTSIARLMGVWPLTSSVSATLVQILPAKFLISDESSN